MYERRIWYWGSAVVIGATALLAYFVVIHSAASRFITAERTVQLEGYGLVVAVADTPLEREMGLSGTTDLVDREGMLFVFEEDAKHSFWMREMNYAIDIIWISADKKVVHIEKNVSPDSFPHSFTPPTPARYVLEVPAGFSEWRGVRIGSEVTL